MQNGSNGHKVEWIKDVMKIITRLAGGATFEGVQVDPVTGKIYFKLSTPIDVLHNFKNGRLLLEAQTLIEAHNFVREVIRQARNSTTYETNGGMTHETEIEYATVALGRH